MKHQPIHPGTATPSTLALSLAVLGIPTAPVETPEAEALYIRAAGEKVRLARAIEVGGIAKFRAVDLLLKLERRIQADHTCSFAPPHKASFENHSPVINGPYPHLSATHTFLRDYGAAIDAVCATATRIENERRAA